MGDAAQVVWRWSRFRLSLRLGEQVNVGQGTMSGLGRFRIVPGVEDSMERLKMGRVKDLRLREVCCLGKER